MISIFFLYPHLLSVIYAFIWLKTQLYLFCSIYEEGYKRWSNEYGSIHAPQIYRGMFYNCHNLILSLYLLFLSRVSGLPSCVSGQGYKIGPMRLCVCLSVSTLLTEPFDVRTQNLVGGLTMTISWTSSMVKVIGQRSKVKVVIFKIVIFLLFLMEIAQSHFVMTPNVTWRYGVPSWHPFPDRSGVYRQYSFSVAAV